MRMRIIGMGLTVLLAQAGSAAAGGATLRLGGFWPSGDSTLFDDVESLYTRGNPDVGVTASDFATVTGGIEFSWALAPFLEVGLHGDVAQQTVETSLRDWLDDATGLEIRQSLRLSIVPIGATLRVIPTARSARLAPYLAAGVDAVYWKYEEWGEFVDFAGDLQIVEDWFAADGVTLGAHVAGGLRVAIGDDFSLVGEARYLFAGQDMGDDFRGSRIDLSGFSATAGLHLRF